MKSARDVIADVFYRDSIGVGTQLSFEAADMYLEALDAAGYVVAPREPTDAQLDAAGKEFWAGVTEHERVGAVDRPFLRFYRAMLAAMPDAAPQQAPTAAPACQHARLRFNSGDYYLTCESCHLRWATVSSDRPEYWQRLDGNWVGTDPTKANQGFHQHGDDRDIRSVGAPQSPTHAPNAIRTPATAHDAETARAAEIGATASYWRHKKRGTEYAVVGRGHLQTDRPLSDNEPVVAYRSVKADGMFWVRPVDEFEDGRFECIPAVPEQSADIEPPGCPTPGACSCTGKDEAR